MSEYQYYEFRAIDRPLDAKAMAGLRKISTRAEITPTGLTNTYHRGDFKGKPAALMDRHFDAFLSFANWGTHRLMFRIPRRLLDLDAAKAYCVVDDEGDDRPETPVPPGLGRLTAAQRAVAGFLRVDEGLIQVAATGSSGEPPAEPSRADLGRWIKGLPAAQKDDYLLRFLAEDGDIPLRAELTRRFREAAAPRGVKVPTEAGRRTAAQLLAARDALVEEKECKAARRESRERTRLAKVEAAARETRPDDLARRAEAAWGQVDEWIAWKKPKEYDLAVDRLVDFRDLAQRSGRAGEVGERIRELRRRPAGKSRLIKRFDAKGLGE